MLTSMRLDRMAALLHLPVPANGDRVEIMDLAYDSRSVTPGALFFCIAGRRQDGHLFADDAVRSGASALVCERPLSLNVPQLAVASARAAMNCLASPFFGDPSRELGLVGVTGTKGKTTTAFLLDSIHRAAGDPGALIGTIEVRVAGEAAPGVRTTPESADLQRLFRKMVDAGVSRCAMEVTSQGIDEGRIEGTHFDVAVFTNLSQDHLDHHLTMERYFAAKRILFTPERTARALINLDDSWGRSLRSETDLAVTTYGTSEAADLRAVEVAPAPGGSRFRAVGDGIDVELLVPLAGEFNVLNALAAIGAAHLLRTPPEAIVAGIEGLQGVPGRVEAIDEGQEFRVLVDYAHTPASLERVLAAAREMAAGRVIVVFGCGGDRDASKRPLMGRAAGERADLAILTSDNPRSEDPRAIIAEIEGGLRAAPPPLGYLVAVDRADAIRRAIEEARDGDVVVIAGKGHETGQEFAGGTIPFDDRQVAAEALRRRVKG